MNAIDIAALRASTSVSLLIAKYLKLTRAGREWKACCPFHADRSPSFTINDEKGFAHCFGCGWHGDVLDFLQKMEGVGLRRAAELISQVPAVVPYRSPEPRRQTQSELETQAKALRIWHDAVSISGTPAETYLRSRGLICRLPECVRYARLRYGQRGTEYPVLIALAATPDGQATGIQRTYLNEAGTGKASVPNAKLSLGRLSGSAIRLAPPAGELVICEGLEDALTLQQEMGVATWATAGVGNLRSLNLPAGVRSVIIGADNDPIGERGARHAAERFAKEGRKARIIRPFDGHKDFNAELMSGVAP